MGGKPGARSADPAALPSGASAAGLVSPAAPDVPIAVVGMGCRLPDADDPAALLDVVLTQRRAFRRLPPGRIDLLDYYSADPTTPDATYSTRAALLEGWQFDWRAFEIPEPVYRAADPAHWLALETAARALAAAGFPGGTGLAAQRTGVFIGNTLTGDSARATALRLRWPYVRRVLAEAMARADIPRDRAAQVLRLAAARYLAPFPAISGQTLADGQPATIAARICGHFGFRGGSLAVDGSSVSSLLAVTAACTALATGELDVALAGGVDLSLDPFELVGLAKTGTLASGDVRVYDENPTGFLPGEGCGLVVLMRAADARHSGVPSYAEIAGWGVSSGGRPGPAEADQASHLLALNRAYQRARIDPADVQLIEGHGAGTQDGDVAELTALAQLGAGTRQRAALGSIKANIGHAQAAAGSAGLIKTVLALSTGLIPPTTGFAAPHPLLTGGDTALWLPQAPSAWPDGVRIAGVSAMGTGGGNAHIVLRGWPDRGRHKARPGGPAAARGVAGRAWPGSGRSRAGSMGTGPGGRGSGGRGSGGRGSGGTGSGGTGSGGVAGGGAGPSQVTRPRGPDGARAGTGLAARGWLPSGGRSRAAAYLLHAPDRGAMHQVLNRIAQVAPWLSDGEMSDFACQLARDARVQGPIRIAIVASRQEQLARLARDAMTLLPRLADGLLAIQPGVYAADGADGRVTLLLPGGSGPGLARAAAQPGSQAQNPLPGDPLPRDPLPRDPQRSDPQRSDPLGQDSPSDPPRREPGQPGGGPCASDIYHPSSAEIVRITLSALSWLERLGVRATAAVGFGQGELAGLAWAGCLAEPDAVSLAGQLAEILASAQTQQSGPAERAARLRTTAARVRLLPPRRRLIVASTGAELAAILDVTEVLCAQLDPPARLERALRAGAIGASLCLETGPGHALAEMVSAWGRVPAVSLAAGTGTGQDAARAVAALFAVGALANPETLPAGQPARPFDLWRDHVFITNPCQVLPRTPAIPAQPSHDAAVAADLAPPPPPQLPPAQPTPAPLAPPGGAPLSAAQSVSPLPAPPLPASMLPAPVLPAPAPPDPATIPASPAGQTPPSPGSGDSRSDSAAPPPRQASPAWPVPPSSGPPLPGLRLARPYVPSPGPWRPEPSGHVPPQASPPAVPSPAVPSPAVLAQPGPAGSPAAAAAQAAAVPGVAPWVRCFAERLEPADWLTPASPGAGQRWRVRASASDPLKSLVSELFPADPSADRVLAITADPTDGACCVTALLAAQDAITCGQLVVITHGPGFTGFFASLHAEHPGLGITVLRVSESADGLRAAQRYAVTQPGRFRELVIDGAGHPYQTSLVPVPADGQGTSPLGPADVVLVSRGAGGATLALVQVLACCGAAIAVIGRTDPAGDGEIAAGLEALRTAGARVTTEIVDMASADDRAAAIGRIERKLGVVTAIVHAAEPGAPRPLGGLTETGLRANVAAQTAGLSQLLAAVRRDRLGLIVTFGSIASRYGLARGGMLALASGSLACQAERAADSIQGCRALHVDWPGWTGPATRRPAIADRLARAGVSPLPVDEGSRLLLKMLTTTGFPASAAVHGRIGSLGPAPAAGYRDGRFIQAVRIHYPGVELVCEAQLSARADPYLADYRIDGRSVLPVAMALEAMAQAASVLADGPVRRAAGVAVHAPVAIPADRGDGTLVIRVCALRDGDTVTVVLRSADDNFADDRVRAVFSCGQAQDGEPTVASALPELDEMAASDAGIVDGTELYGQLCFQSGRFRRAALLPEVTPRSCRALLHGGDDQPWFGELADEPAAPLILGSPGLADATWHMLQACVPHRRLELAGCASVQFSGLTADGAVEVRALRVPVIPRQSRGQTAGPPAAPAEYVWDVEAIDGAGRPLISWTGLRLRDAGPLRRGRAWPPALLAVYLEHAAAALDLHPDLRIAIQRSQPDGDERQAVVVPAPAPAADDPPAGRTRAGSPAASVAPGRGALAGFELIVRAPAGAACQWAAAAAEGAQAPDAGAAGHAPGLAGLADDLRHRLSEPPAVLAARLAAVTGCRTAPSEPVELAAGGTDDGWVRLRAPGAAFACGVVHLDGVPNPVAVAIMTGAPEPGRPRPLATAGQKSASTSQQASGPGQGKQTAGPAKQPASTAKQPASTAKQPADAAKPPGGRPPGGAGRPPAGAGRLPPAGTANRARTQPRKQPRGRSPKDGR